MTTYLCRYEIFVYWLAFLFGMTQIFNLSSCTNDLRRYARPLWTKEELSRLIDYSNYQKHLAIRLVKYQRLLTSKYNRRSIRCSNSRLPIEPRNSTKSKIDQTAYIDEFSLQCKPLINAIDIPIIKLNRCSTLIATGHGIANQASPLIDISTERFSCGIIDEDISLSRLCRNILSR